MQIVPGKGLLLRIPYADGEPADKQRPFLVINVQNRFIEMLNVSSVKGKERELLWPSNKLIMKYYPPFCAPSFVKLDSLYEIELFEELNYLVLEGGKLLDQQELEMIKESFIRYRNSNQINTVFYNKIEVEKYNSIYIAKRISATSKD